MNKVILQFWEESERGKDIRPSGCSLHLDDILRNKYIDEIYKDRDGDFIPIEYERIIGHPIEAFVSNDLFKNIKLNESIRIDEHELNNLMIMFEIIIKNDK